MLLNLQNRLPYNSFLYVSQNHLLSKDGRPPVEKLRLLIPLAEPIRQESDRKIVEQLFINKFKSSLDTSFMQRARYFAHGHDAIESFVSDRGFLNWKELPGYGGEDVNVQKSKTRRKPRDMGFDIDANTFRLDDKVKDEHEKWTRIKDVMPGQRIFCVKCG